MLRHDTRQKVGPATLFPQLAATYNPPARQWRLLHKTGNIGLFPDAAERAHYIENTLALFFDGEEAPPPPGVRQGYGEELHMLADLERDLFPWRFETVMEAGLKRTPRGDVLVVDNGKVVERIELSRPLPPRGCLSTPKPWCSCTGTRRRNGGRWSRPAPRRGWSSRWRPRTW